MCGSNDIASDRVAELVIDAMVAKDLVPLTYIAPPNAPYTLVVSTNPVRPLMTNDNPLPG